MRLTLTQLMHVNPQVIAHYDNLTDLQARAFADILSAFPNHRDTITGVYTGLEEANTRGWMEPTNLQALATHYFEPLAQRVRKISGAPSLQVLTLGCVHLV